MDTTPPLTTPPDAPKTTPSQREKTLENLLQHQARRARAAEQRLQNLLEENALVDRETATRVENLVAEIEDLQIEKTSAFLEGLAGGLLLACAAILLRKHIGGTWSSS